MTTFSAILSGQIDSESPYDTTLAGQQSYNHIAVIEKAVGAPVLANDYIVQAMISADAVGQSEIAANAVGQSEIAANVVGQSEIRESNGTVSTASTTGVRLTLPGGAYGFYPRTYETGDGMIAYMSYFTQQQGAAAVCNIYLRIITTGTAYANQYYITASKPYDLGDGEVGRFIFAVIDNATGKVERVYQATEAPWHYNGKTDIRGKIGKDGKKYRLRKDMSSVPFTFDSSLSDVVKMQEYIDAFSAAKVTNELITQELCQRDMVDIPHPFMGNDLTGKTVVMLDPVSDFNHKLSEMCACHDEFDLNGLLHDGYLTIDNNGQNLSGPPGILIPSFKWKNTI